MPVQVLMPQLGESVDEGTLTKWLKAEGESVREMEPLVEVNTDKVDTEIPAPASGVVLKILIPEGTVVRAGALMAWIGDPSEGTPAPQGQPTGAEGDAVPQGSAPPTGIAAPPQAPASEPSGGRGFISPVVAKIAAEHQVDLSKITGTGLSGRITKKDVEAYIAQRAATPAVTPAPVVAPAAPVAPRPAPAALPADADFLPHTGVRRAIAEHMVMSKRTSPHVTTVMEADLSRVVAHRAANKAAFARDGVNLTFTAYFMLATAAALKAFPMVNSTWTDDGLILHRTVNLGMATSLGADGLIVPVIKHAQDLSLLGMARAVNDLAARARGKQLKPDEVKGGTFTVTNHGVSGSLFATPVINQPQCGILGVGLLQKRAVVITDPNLGDVIAIRPMVYLSFTFDHRILDGAAADNFLAKVVESLQNWA
ncbi:MAG: dihydrolipoamide acetyltransferase family protein [Anaerolineales bacterium]